MNSGLFKVYDVFKLKHRLTLEIRHNGSVNWYVVITSQTRSNEIVNVQEYDLDLALAKAEVRLKEWLINNNGGIRNNGKII